MKISLSFCTFILVFAVLALLSTILLALPKYISVQDTDKIYLGLSSATVAGITTPYDSLYESCDLGAVCPDVQNLKTAGIILKACLIVDTILLLSFLAVYIAPAFQVKKLMKEYLEHKDDRSLRCVKAQYMLRNSVYAHPVLLIAGLVAWVCVCEFPSIQSKIDLESGIVLLVVDIFLSFLACAIYFYHTRRFTSDENIKQQDLTPNQLTVI